VGGAAIVYLRWDETKPFALRLVVSPYFVLIRSDKQIYGGDEDISAGYQVAF
jgi:hypothetical protein